MELSPEEKQKIEAEEKERIKARQKVEAEEAAKGMTSCMKLASIGCLAIIAIGLIIGAITFLTSRTSSKSTTSSSFSSPRIGLEARLYVEGAQSVYIAIDEKAFDEFTDAGIAKDKIGIANLIMTGRIFSVDNNTKALVIDKTFTKTKVRVLEGKNIGMAGWVAHKFVK
jgi:hypothetical protein